MFQFARITPDTSAFSSEKGVVALLASLLLVSYNPLITVAAHDGRGIQKHCNSAQIDHKSRNYRPILVTRQGRFAQLLFMLEALQFTKEQNTIFSTLSSPSSSHDKDSPSSMSEEVDEQEEELTMGMFHQLAVVRIPRTKALPSNTLRKIFADSTCCLR